MRSRMIAASIGIALVGWLPVLPSNMGVLSLLIVQMLLYIWGFKALSSQWQLRLIYFSFGLLYSLYCAQLVMSQLLPITMEGKSVDITGEIVQLPETVSSYSKPSQRFIMKVSSSPKEIDVKKVKLFWHGGPSVIPGQQWRLKVKLFRPRGLQNPSGFDYQHWLIQQGIGATGQVVSHESNSLIRHRTTSLDYYRWRLAQHLKQRLDHLEFSGLINTLLLGDKRGVSPEQWLLFANTGTIHLMVISGLHIGIIAILGFAIGRSLSIVLFPSSNILVATITALLFAVIYSAAAGFSLPTQRALVMLSVGMLILSCARNIPISYGFCLAIICCLTLNPLAATTVSFYLSFGAVATILYGTVGRRTLTESSWYKLLSLQIKIFIGMAPLLLLLFNQLPLSASFINIIAIPLFSLIIIPVLFSAAILSVVDKGFISHYLFQLVDDLLHITVVSLEYINSISSPFIFYDLPWYLWGLIFVAAFIVLLPKGFPLRHFILIVIIPVILYKPQKIMEGNFDVTVLDVGQGLSIVIQTASHSIVYDTGASWSGGSLARRVVIPFLRSQGISQLDALVISHKDNDHAGGYSEVISSIPVVQVYTGEPLSNSSRHTAPCIEQSWQWDGVSFTFLNAINAQPFYQGNNRSCVLRISTPTDTVLITGDIERPVETRLVVNDTDYLSANVLLAPHHGSLSSSSWPFIREVSPRYVIYSAGYNNTFHHPNRRVQDRYDALGVIPFNTAKQGAIFIKSRYDQPLTIKYQRQNKRHYWQ